MFCEHIEESIWEFFKVELLERKIFNWKSNKSNYESLPSIFSTASSWTLYKHNTVKLKRMKYNKQLIQFSFVWRCLRIFLFSVVWEYFCFRCLRIFLFPLFENIFVWRCLRIFLFSVVWEYFCLVLFENIFVWCP